MSLVSDNVRHSFQLQEAQYAFLRFFLTTNLCLAAEFIFKSLKTRKLGLRGIHHSTFSPTDGTPLGCRDSRAARSRDIRSRAK